MLSSDAHKLFEGTQPVVVAGDDGNLIAQNKPARRLLGQGTGKFCWDVVGKLEDAEMLPCRFGCVLDLLASGADSAQHTEFIMGGRRHHLSCIPVDRSVVCMLSCKSKQLPAAWQSLSPREREILSLLADGETTSSAATLIGVRESTIRTHVERMRTKLSVNTRAAVVAEGFRLGYLS